MTRYEVWARCAHELRPSIRFGELTLGDAVAIAESLGDRLGQPEGTRSVWVERSDTEQVVWACGEKALDLAEQGIRL